MKRIRCVAAIAILLCGIQIPGMRAVAAEKTLYQSPYVRFAPDGLAWTFSEALPSGQTDGKPDYQYPAGETISTGIASALKALQTGQHYYDVEREGVIPVGKWVVTWSKSQCIHLNLPSRFHDITYAEQRCLSGYYSGWFAYCADCNRPLDHHLIYGSRSAVSSVNYIDTVLDHYYLCPSCNHLEQGVSMKHKCSAISYNRYKVIYDSNAEYMGKRIAGSMPDSFHMYNNETAFDGKSVVPSTHLNLNSYELAGYTFTGWNTRPDGRGVTYTDGAEIRNLSTENYDGRGMGEVTLYAQWAVSVSRLLIDPNGGSYCGSREKTSVTRAYGAVYYLEENALVPPDGYTVTYESNGGTAIPKQKSRYTLRRWNLIQPCGGILKNGQYTFAGAMNQVDVVRAVYNREAVILPTPEKQDSIFGGWFRDQACTDFVGMGGTEFIPDRDVILYAGWTNLNIEAEDVYYRDETLNDWRTAGSICYGVKNESGKGDNRYGVPYDSTAVLYASGAVDIRMSTRDASEDFFRVWMSAETDPAVLSSTYEMLKHAGQSTTVEQSVWREMDNSDSGVVTCGERNYDAFFLPENCGTNQQTYQVRADGLYTIRAAGGQGGSFGMNTGGNAGEATMAVYLKKGEKLTITLGKQGQGANASRTPGGYQGGASGTGGAAGGSATRIRLTDLNGMTTDLLVVAGGGGASSMGNGYSAFHQYATLSDLGAFQAALNNYGLVENPEYCDGVATGGGGGGGGFFPGMAGSVVLHVHSDKPDRDGEIEGEMANTVGYCTGWQWVSGGIHKGYVSSSSCEHYGHWGVVNGVCAQACNMDDGSWWYLCKCNVCGGQDSVHVKEIYQYTCSDCGAELGEESCHSHPSCWTLQCSKTEGETVDGAAPAYGGLSFINISDDHFEGNVSYDNYHTGDGYVSVSAVAVGYTESGLISSIPARDKAKPDTIGNVTYDVTDGIMSIHWEEPEGNPSVYYFFGESYFRDGSGIRKRLTTNILSRKVDTAIAGYYYLCDDNALVSADFIRNIVGQETYYTYVNRNAAQSLGSLGFTEDSRLNTGDVGNSGNRAYDVSKDFVHIAAVDVAGNISDTETVRLKQGEVPWSLATTPLRLDSEVTGKDNKNTWYAERERTWYVRADGVTPFLLSYESYMVGTARENYQINHQIIDARTTDGIGQKFSVLLPYTIPVTGTGELDSSGFVRKAAGAAILGESSWLSVSRSNLAADVSFRGAFVLSGEMHGKEIILTPVAGADYKQSTVYSSWDEDSRNSLTITADGKGPVIRGLDCLEQLTLIDGNEEEVCLEVTAADDLSGIAEFYVSVVNSDNFIQEIFPAENGVVRIELTERQPVFSGDFTVIGHAMDRVGNVTEMEYQVTEFALETRIERILAPHEPVFKGGESGILSIITYGYADRVEVVFPEEMVALNPGLNRVIDYTEKQCYKQEAQVQFMIPLYTPENTEYQVIVRAYKGDRRLEDHPVISTVVIQGNVLDELRTRLR